MATFHGKEMKTAMNNHLGKSQRSTRRVKLRVFLAICLVAAVSAFAWHLKRNRDASAADDATGYRGPISAPVVDSSKADDSTSPATVETRHPLDDVLDMARQIYQFQASHIRDYTAVLTKRERIKGRLTNEETMEVKIRNPRSALSPGERDEIPLSVYAKLIPPSSAAGREVIWVSGRNDGDLLSHQFGLPIKIDPKGTLAMMGNKYSITDIGMLRLSQMLIEKGERDRQVGDCRVEQFADQLVGDRKCLLIQVTHPERDPRFEFHIAQIYIDNQLQLPVRYVAYLWPEQPGEAPPLEEECTYSQIKINVGLTDEDFSPRNDNYRFPK